jgi:hypothetical protein
VHDQQPVIAMRRAFVLIAESDYGKAGAAT